MTKAKQYIFYRALCHLYFYAAISIPYYTWRGLSISEAYSITAFNSLLVVLLEYPTGVVGDKFGHKMSVSLSLLLWVMGLLLMALPLPFWGYLVSTVLIALGSSLESGSDIALLKTNSTNFKKDFANYKSITIGTMAVSAAIAGYLSTLWEPLPILLTALTSGIGGLGIYLTNFKESKNSSGNIWAVAKSGLSHVRRTTFLTALILFSGIVAGYQGSLKYVLNSFSEVFQYDITLVSWVLGGSLLLRSIGYKISERLGNIQEQKLIYIILGLIFSSLFIGDIPFAPLMIIPLISFLIAILNFQIVIEINEATTDDIRASVLSLNGMIARLFNSFYLFLVGYLLDFFSFQYMMAATLLLLSTVSAMYIHRRNTVSNVTQSVA